MVTNGSWRLSVALKLRVRHIVANPGAHAQGTGGNNDLRVGDHIKNADAFALLQVLAKDPRALRAEDPSLDSRVVVTADVVAQKL